MVSSWSSFLDVLVDLAWERAQRGDWRLWLALLERQIGR